MNIVEVLILLIVVWRGGIGKFRESFLTQIQGYYH